MRFPWRARSLPFSLLLTFLLLLVTATTATGCACGPVRRSAPPNHGAAGGVPAMMLCVSPPKPTPSSPIQPRA